jgi:hypothetical protein
MLEQSQQLLESEVDKRERDEVEKVVSRGSNESSESHESHESHENHENHGSRVIKAGNLPIVLFVGRLLISMYICIFF